MNAAGWNAAPGPTRSGGIAAIRECWMQIRDEAVALYRAGTIDAATNLIPMRRGEPRLRGLSAAGWKQFHVWQGQPGRFARRLCPATVAIVERVPAIRGAMFSILPPGADLRLPFDPAAGSLRYHLGLETPNSERCFITVDGTRRTWRDGEDFIIDETRAHHAANATDGPLLILVCDLDPRVDARIDARCGPPPVADLHAAAIVRAGGTRPRRSALLRVFRLPFRTVTREPAP
ncbi:MAG TPA: aspartyl/asparaginyl beta-hydroxylase domain-containing protein [Tahibacter sp.]|uniref:aspartyl/asparaginyl beta-hydroxylase domain-containing protein n=1 Tax=Tahibacter sp. TaxID=2056211 RepID=UPI002CE86518|nr:aspartyl/asparaginyl beta-hydroxylase domain-containing protein [Tahibacter sp.]HSX61957.1 aspartyl/asparaginyl beta-hydroxylase domain-containing protein [Tahibacter sp.]